MRNASPTYRAIYRTVKRIPKGKIATYGQVASLAGVPGAARQVGYALHALKEGNSVPWHRVVNARGAISKRSSGWSAEIDQRLLLEAEGVKFDAVGRIQLARFQWRLSS
ncbi:MAG: methylated-DNA--[protein]-cysteine S-methyltransferase [Gemmatimonadales bacterium]